MREVRRNRLGKRIKQYGAVILILLLIVAQFPMKVLAENIGGGGINDYISVDDEGEYAGDFEDDGVAYAIATSSNATHKKATPSNAASGDDIFDDDKEDNAEVFDDDSSTYAYNTPSVATPADATPANANFRKAMTSGNTAAAERFATYINTFNHGGSGRLTATAVGNTITVEGSVTEAAKTFTYTQNKETIIIDWRADYEGNGSTGGLLEFYGSAIQFNLNGGKIIRSASSDGAYAFVFSSCQASLNGGTVQGELGIHITSGRLSINNGAVISSLKFAIYSRGSHIEITGGTLSVSGESADCIALSESSELTMTDGSISSDGKGGCAIGAGENSVVDIQGGIISAAGPGGRVVREYNAGKITIIDSDISLSGLWVNETEASIDEYNCTAYVVLPDKSPFPTEASAITIIPKDADANISLPQMLDEHIWLFTIESGCLRQSYLIIEIMHSPGRASGGGSGSTTTDPSVLTGTWERTDTGFWKFRLTNGRYAANRWGIADGRWYYFDTEGIMQTGWQYIGDVWYYLSTEADAKTKAQTKEGAMMTGWYYDSIYGGWFYFGSNGAMATGNREIDGKPYYFNTEPDGRQGILTE